MGDKQKLKDPIVCRVFFSSPLLGMEKEREELTRLYFPQLQHLCSSKGIQFAAVDLRWGITMESSQSAKTIDICLKELDRSDIFVGFFGQRYGWCGTDDEVLQKNFDVALPHFPWLDQFRDRSVTEVEFLHGFLNNPGERPTCVCFRDKEYDDRIRESAEASGDVRTVKKYSAESENAVAMLSDLKQRVKDVESKCLHVDMAYKSPEEGAKLMFNAIWKYLSEELLVESRVDLPASQQQEIQHKAFCDSLCGLHVGGGDYMSQLNPAVGESSGRHCLIIGEPGIGKSALLSNWIKRTLEGDGCDILLYHFVGFPEQSTEVQNVLNRFSAKLSKSLGKSAEFKPAENAKTGMGQLTLLLNDADEAGRRVCVVIDGLEKLGDRRKAGKNLYWLPKTLPTSVTVFVSTLATDTPTIEELVENRGYTTLTINGLKSEDKRDMCLGVLKSNSKELPKDQLEMITSTKQTDNPLYLKILMQELCVVDYYRKILGKIEYLLTSDSITSLFDKYLERLEQDYSTEDHPNVVKDVVCHMYVSHHGLSEEEIVEILDIPFNTWVPLYYALDFFLLKQSRLLRFAYSELREAVYDRFITGEEKHQYYAKNVLDHFMKKYNGIPKAASIPSHHTSMVLELPRLLVKLQDWNQLAEVLSDLRILQQLNSYDRHMLIEFWQNTGKTGDEICMLYLKSIKQAVVDIYLKQLDEYEELNPLKYIWETYCDEVLHLVDNCVSFKGREILLYYYQHMITQMKCSESERLLNLLNNHYRLAQLYTDMEKMKEAKTLYQRLYDRYQKLDLNTRRLKLMYGDCLHSIGYFYLKQSKFTEANEWFRKALEIYKTMTGLMMEKAHLLNNLGLINLELGNLDTSIEVTEHALKMYDSIYFGELPSHVGQTMLNLAICYRRKGQVEDAKKTYERCLKISIEALGPKHPHVGKVYMNQGIIAISQDDFVEAERLSKKGMEIFKGVYPHDHWDVIRVTENVMQSLWRQEKWDEAEPFFWETFDILVKQDRLEHGLTFIQASFAERYYLMGMEKDRDEELLNKARNILVHIIPYTDKPIGYVYLSIIDHFYPTGQDRPYNLTLDAGMERFPKDDRLVCKKVQLDLALKENLDEILQFLHKVEEHFDAPKIHIQFVYWLGVTGHKPLAGGVANYILGLFGSDLLYDVCVQNFTDEELKFIVEHFCNTLTNQKDYCACVPFITKLAQVCPDQLGIQMGCIKLCLLGVDFEGARRVIAYVAEHWNEDENVVNDMVNYSKATDYAEEEMKKIWEEERKEKQQSNEKDGMPPKQEAQETEVMSRQEGGVQTPTGEVELESEQPSESVL